MTLTGVLVGGVLAYLVISYNSKKQSNSIISEAKKEAEQIKKDKILQSLILIYFLVLAVIFIGSDNFHL